MYLGISFLLSHVDEDDDSCCRDPIQIAIDGDDNQLLKGAFSDVYQKAMQEELPESEPLIKDSIDYKFSIRQV